LTLAFAGRGRDASPIEKKSCISKEEIIGSSKPGGIGATTMPKSSLPELKHLERSMTLIEVHLIERVFSPEQKHQIIEKLTNAMVSIEGERMRGVTWVKISEVTSGDWGVGGQPLTAEALRALIPRDA
jgi:4-oxalocrotonate tautomerase